MSGGIPNPAAHSGAELGQRSGVIHHLPPNARGKKKTHSPQPLPWPPAGKRQGFWGDYRLRIKSALQAWRSKADDRTLARIRSELALELAERAVSQPLTGHPAGAGGALAEERAVLLLRPSKSIGAAERVERVAILDNAIALLRLKQIITDQQYRAAVVDTVYAWKNSPAPSTTPVTWLPHRPAGAETEAASPVDPNRKIRTRYRIVDLAEPILSHTPTGAVNPAYDAALQPRQRERVASRLQIDHIAKNLDSASLLKFESNWSEGPPIVGDDGMVESGNGRLLALRRAIDLNPAGYSAYRDQLIKQARQFGLDPADIKATGQPVLVRERLTPLSAQERLRFVNEANASGVARMGVSEQAQADAQLIPVGFFADLQTAETGDLFETLTKKANGPMVARFLELLPPTERATLIDRSGQLNLEGVKRLERALFAYILPDEAGKRLAYLIFEEGEAIDRVGAGLRQSLLKLGQMEAMIRAGQRAEQLSLKDDSAAVIEKMRDIREQGLSVNDYLRQYKMFPELSALQEQLLIQLSERRRSARAIARLFSAYADEVISNTPSPDQLTFSGLARMPDREALLRVAVKKIGGVWVDLKRWSAAQQALSGVA